MNSVTGGGNVPAGAELGTFGKYHLIASLGQGGMANVFLALMAGPSGFNKLLVIKIMRQDVLAGSVDAVRMFMAEARLAARLVHPNIVHTYEVGELDGRYFLAMEYLDGQPLGAVLNRARGAQPIPLAEYLRVISDVARGLHYAHNLRGYQGESLEVVHRDVSPQNVIVTYDGQVKLLDFGIAKTADTEQLTQAGTIKGKLDYIAPEQLRSDRVDRRADIFALGAMLWEVISGQRFAGGRRVSDLDKMQQRLVGGERKLRELRPDVPPALEAIVERAIALAPEDRFDDAGELADVLDAHLEQMGLRASGRSLAQHMERLFADERVEMHKLIDEQVQRVKRGSLSPGPTSGVNVRAPNKLSLYLAEHVDERSSIRSMASPQALSTPVSRRPGGSWLGLGAALLALASGAGAMWFVLATQHQEPAAPAPVAAPPAALAPERSEAPASEPERPVSAVPRERPGADSRERASAGTLRLQVKVEPATARVSLDGVPLTMPFDGSFPKDGALHRLEASADGHRPLKQFVAFDDDRTLELKLERAAGGKRWSLDRLIERAEQSAQPDAPAPSAPVKAEPKAGPREPKRAPAATEERPNPYDE